jgi:hypothetical protein
MTTETTQVTKLDPWSENFFKAFILRNKASMKKHELKKSLRQSGLSIETANKLLNAYA